MKRFLLLLAAVALVVSACGGGDSDTESGSPDRSSATTKPSRSSDDGGDGATGSTVVVKGLKFTPSTLKVKAGDSVQFDFDDGVTPHNAVAADGSFKTDIVTKQTVTVTVAEAGRHPYSCTVHPTMKGVIVAE